MNIKSEKEIKIMSKSGLILSKVLKEIKKKIKPGVSTKSLDEYAEKIILNYGAKPAFKGFKGYPNTTCISINHELVHALPSSKKIIKPGDIVSVDCGVLYEGYNTDAAFTFGVGKISQQAKNLIKITKKSLDEAIKIIKPDIHISKVQKIIQTILEENGLSVVKTLSGHGIGKKVHEPPSIYNYVGQGPDIILKEGMVFCLEPMAIAGSAGVKTEKDGWTIISSDRSLTAHFEHTIAITKFGHKVLTK